MINFLCLELGDNGLRDGKKYEHRVARPVTPIQGMRHAFLDLREVGGSRRGEARAFLFQHQEQDNAWHI